MTGTPRTYNGQVYRAIGTFMRARRDGTLATIIVWSSNCADCGAPFQVTTPAAATKFAPNRRCPRHKRPGVRVRGAHMPEILDLEAARQRRLRQRAADPDDALYDPFLPDEDGPVPPAAA